MENIAPMVVAIVLIVSVTGAILLRPLARHLADLLEAMARQRASDDPRIANQLEQLRESMQTQSERLALMEERLEFTESIVRRKAPQELGHRPPEAKRLSESASDAGSE
jgi:hypothetical protein